MKPKLIDETQIKMLKPNQLKKLNQTTQTEDQKQSVKTKPNQLKKSNQTIKSN